MAVLPRAVRRQVFRVRPIVAGYEWRLRINLPYLTIANGTLIVADVKRDENDQDVLVRLTTANGSITRFDEHTIDVTIAGTVSRDWPKGSVVFDFSMPALNPPVYMGLKTVAPVRRPVTEAP